MGHKEFAEGATDFSRAVQHESPAHAGRGASVDLVEQRCAEKVGAVGGRNELIVRSVEDTLIVLVGGVEGEPRRHSQRVGRSLHGISGSAAVLTETVSNKSARTPRQEPPKEKKSSGMALQTLIRRFVHATVRRFAFCSDREQTQLIH